MPTWLMRMFTSRWRVPKRVAIMIATVGGSLLLLVACTLAIDPNGQGGRPQIAPEAAHWQTWIVTADDNLLPAAPPDQAATQAEIAELKALAASRDAADQALVTYWDAGSPAYRWVQIATDRHKMLPPGPAHGRAMALMTVAIYDAMIVAWDAKYTYNRPRPNAIDHSLTTLVTSPNSPSYPSEHAVAAGAASAVLAYLFPEEADLYLAKAEEAARSRLLAGVQYPSDVAAGLALGRAVAEKLIERGMHDGSDAVWDGVAHTEPGAWYWAGNGPFLPTAGTWQPWLLTSNDQLLPPPPPAYDSPERAAELLEVKAYTRTFASNAVAFFWQSHPGVKAYWFETAGRLIAENRLDDNAPYSTLIYATLSVGMADSFIACWNAKYTYWTIRPWQLDPEITTIFPSPNHPSYPAAHGCNSGAGETVMAGFFPADAAALIAIGEEGIQSRLWAGIHYQSDIDEGSKIGQLAAQIAVDHAKGMMQP